jgi:hypothetical protein
MNTWYNPTEPKDVNGDLAVTSADLQEVTDFVTAYGVGAGHAVTVDPTIKACPGVNPTATPYPSCASSVKFYPDMNNDGVVDAADVGVVTGWITSECGKDGVQTDLGEQCDLSVAGTLTGCANVPYGTTCNYCDTTCKSHAVPGGFCGDGVVQQANEQCDDGKHCSLAHSINCTAAPDTACVGHGTCVKLNNSCNSTCQFPPIPFIN